MRRSVLKWLTVSLTACGTPVWARPDCDTLRHVHPEGSMRRREFMTIVSGAAMFAPLSGFAQETGRTYRLGVLTVGHRRQSSHDNFFDELRRHGFVEGQNLLVDGRGYEARVDQFPALAAGRAKAEVEAIMCSGPAATRAGRDATRHIPIIEIVDDMIAAGFVASLARPGGNITGISILAPELDSKRLDILIELAPNSRRIAALAEPNSTASPRLQRLQDAAQARGVELSIHMVDVPEQIVPAIDEAKRNGAMALNVLASPMLHTRAWRYHRACCYAAPARNLPMGGKRGRRRTRRLRSAHTSAISADGPAARQSIARHEARRSPGRTTERL